jgi:hypothetical protein
MVRRRSTVRFRKGAPAYRRLSNLLTGYSVVEVPFEWQSADREVAGTRHLGLRETVSFSRKRCGQRSGGAAVGQGSVIKIVVPLGSWRLPKVACAGPLVAQG